MANPRKFSEKIALHNQKQAEETAAFEQIMREVIGVRGPSYPNNQHQLHINPQSMGSCRVGSLPNVNQIGQVNNSHADKNSIDLQAALTNLEEMKQGRDGGGGRERQRHVSPMSRQPHHQQPHPNRHFQFDQKRDTSPYSTSNYLSPPPDGSWRRTNSDSALHQSAMIAQNQQAHAIDGFHHIHHNVVHNSMSPRRSTVHGHMDNSAMLDDSSCPEKWTTGGARAVNNCGNSNKQSQQSFMLSASLPNDNSRPKSCEVPGITIYSTPEDPNASHHSHIPISTNTGSLPDLTSLTFPAPLTTPIDVEDQIGGMPQSPYSLQNSPQSPHSATLSPATLSPPSTLPSHHQQQQLNRNSLTFPSPLTSDYDDQTGMPQSPYASLQNSPQSPHSVTLSPPSFTLTSPHHQQQQQQQMSGNAQGGGRVGHHQQQHSGSHSGSSSPIHQPQQVCYDQRCHVRNEAPMITVEGITLDTSALSLENNSYMRHQQQQQHPHQQQQQQTAHNFGYSADHQQQQQYHHNVDQSQNYVPPHSPLQAQMAMGLYRSATPSDHSCSAPTSPVSNNISPLNSPGLPQNHLSKSPFSDNSYFEMGQQTSVLQHHQLDSQFPMLRGNNQDFAKDIGSAMASMSGSFDTSDLFPSDDALRAGLDPIDFDGLQILQDIADNTNDDTFRLERS